MISHTTFLYTCEFEIFVMSHLNIESTVANTNQVNQNGMKLQYEKILKLIYENETTLAIYGSEWSIIMMLWLFYEK